MPQLIPLSTARVFLVSATYNPANVVANTQAVNATTLTITGLLTGDYIECLSPVQQQGLFLKRVVCTAINTASFTFENITGSDINPGSETYILVVYRPNGAIPTSIS